MSNRAAVKRRIRDVATFAVSTNPVDLGVTGRTAVVVPVAYGVPPDTASSTCLYFGGITNGSTDGRTDPTAMRMGAPVTDDVFTIKGSADAYGFVTVEGAEEAAERILSAFVAVLSRLNQLVDPTDALADGDPSAYKVQSAQLADWSLEGGQVSEGDLFVARASFQVRCTSTKF